MLSVFVICGVGVGAFVTMFVVFVGQVHADSFILVAGLCLRDRREEQVVSHGTFRVFCLPRLPLVSDVIVLALAWPNHCYSLFFSCF